VALIFVTIKYLLEREELFINSGRGFDKPTPTLLRRGVKNTL
jgi:hypothetical protein